MPMNVQVLNTIVTPTLFVTTLKAPMSVAVLKGLLAMVKTAQVRLLVVRVLSCWNFVTQSSQQKPRFMNSLPRTFFLSIIRRLRCLTPSSRLIYNKLSSRFFRTFLLNLLTPKNLLLILRFSCYMFPCK